LHAHASGSSYEAEILLQYIGKACPQNAKMVVDDVVLQEDQLTYLPKMFPPDHLEVEKELSDY
jgi:hypothetical protein